MFALLPTPHPPLDPSLLQTISPTQYTYSLPSSLSFSHIVIFLLPGNTLPADTAAGIYIRFPSAPGQPEKDFKLLGALGEGKASAIFKVDGKGGGGGGNWIGIGSGSGNGEKGGIVGLGSSGEGGGVEEVDMDADEDEGMGGGGDVGMVVSSTTGAVAGMGNAMDASAGAAAEAEIVLGISIEPIATLGPQLAALAQNKPTSQMTLAPNASGALSLSKWAPSAQAAAGSGGSGSGAGGSENESPSGIPTKVLAQRIIKNAFNFLASFAGNTAGGQEVVPLKSFEEWWRKFERRVENDPGFLEREGD